MAHAISSERYEEAVKKLQPYVNSLSIKWKYNLALLYDHAAGHIRFYLRQGNMQKAKRYSLKLNPLLQKEFKKPQYKGFHMLTSKFIMDIKKDILSIGTI